jgi:hypothetical protein
MGFSTIYVEREKTGKKNLENRCYNHRCDLLASNAEVLAVYTEFENMEYII